MPLRILWDTEEAAILLDALTRTMNGTLLWKDAVTSVSQALRSRAICKGMTIDEKFRNINGIALKMQEMRYLFTDGESGLNKSSFPPAFQEVVQLYKTNRPAFNKLLEEAQTPMSESVQEQFIRWLTPKVSAARLSPIYLQLHTMEEKCHEAMLFVGSFFENPNIRSVKMILDLVKSNNKIFHFARATEQAAAQTALQYYYDFLLEQSPATPVTPPPKEEVPPVVKPLPPKVEPVTPPQPKEEKHPAAEPLPLKTPSVVFQPPKRKTSFLVDLETPQSMEFTTPVSFSYFGDLHDSIFSWKKLYMQVVACLWDDYPDRIAQMVNTSLTGGQEIDIGDRYSLTAMNDPRKIAINLFLETDLSATTIIKKIRALLDLCNVDYDQLEIRYTPDIETPAVSKPVSVPPVVVTKSTSVPSIVTEPVSVPPVIAEPVNVPTVEETPITQNDSPVAAEPPAEVSATTEGTPVPLEEAPQDDAPMVIDFRASQPLLGTKPVYLGYFYEETTDIASWAQLYVQVIDYLLHDFPGMLLPLLGTNFSGGLCVDFGTSEHAEHMVTPQKVGKFFYLETNLPAEIFIDKIHRVLALCHVDDEYLTIKYVQVSAEKPAPVPEAPKEEEPPVPDALKAEEKPILDVPTEEEIPASTAEAEPMPLLEVPAEAPIVPGKKPAPVSTGDSVLDYLSANGLEYIDLRNKWDCLWIIGGWEIQPLIQPLIEAGVCIHFKTRGGTATGGRPAWYIRAQTSRVHLNRPEERKPEAPAVQPVAPAPAAEPHPVQAAVTPVIEKTPTVYVPVAESFASSSTEEERLSILLKERYSENGYRLGSPIAFAKFKIYYADAFGASFPDSVSSSVLEARLRAIGVELNGYVYPRRNTTLLNDILQDILTTLNDGATCVYISSVYEKYRQELETQLRIYNEDALQELLLKNAQRRLIKQYNYFTIGWQKADPTADVTRVMKECYEPKTYEELHRILWYLPLDKISNVLGSHSEFAYTAKGTFYYAPNLPVSKEELTQIASIITNELDSRGFVIGSALIRLIYDRIPMVQVNTDFLPTLCVRNCLAYLLRDQFSFRGNIISAFGAELKMGDVYAAFARDQERFTLEDIKAFSEEVDCNIYWDAVRKEVVRLSEKEFIRKDLITFDVEAIDHLLDTLCPGDYKPLKDISGYLHFPSMGYPWNGFVLESYVYHTSKQFWLTCPTFGERNFSGAMVRRSSNLAQYYDIIVDSLSRWDRLSTATPEAALKYIVDCGFQLRLAYNGILPALKEAKLLQEKRMKEEK